MQQNSLAPGLPLGPAYWRQANAQLKSIRMLALAGLVSAMIIVLKGMPVLLIGTTLKIQFTFLVISVGCYVYGPTMGILVGMVTDTLGFLVSNFGDPYFPGYMITAMLSGLIYGLFLFRQRLTILRLIILRLVINYGINVLLGSVWKAMLFGKGYYYYFTTGLVKNTLMLPVEVILTVAVFRLLLPTLRRSGLVPSTGNEKGRIPWF